MKSYAQKLIIGLCGQAGSGKDTIADHLVSKYGFVKVGLADLVKRMTKMAFGFSDEQLWGPSELRNQADKRYMRREVVDLPGHSPETELRGLTPRYALQRLGTEWGRDCYENVWIEAALGIAQTLLSNSSNACYRPEKGLVNNLDAGMPSNRVFAGVVIPDVRFRNEIEAIRATSGGKVVRVYRPQTTLSGAAAKHSSETELQTIDPKLFDYIFQNDSDLHTLYRTTDRMMDVFYGRIMEFDQGLQDAPPFLREKCRELAGLLTLTIKKTWKVDWSNEAAMDLWALVSEDAKNIPTTGPIREVSFMDVLELRRLSSDVNGWFYWDDKTYKAPCYIRSAAWREKYSALRSGIQEQVGVVLQDGIPTPTRPTTV